MRDPCEDERLEAEAALADELYAYWTGQQKRVLAALRAEQASLAVLRTQHQTSKELTLDWQAEEMLLTAQIGELLGQIVQGALEATAVAGVGVSWEIFDQEAAALAQKYGYELIKQITDSTRQQLGKLISRWIETDADFEDLVADVRRLIPENPFPNVRDRARLIAATEVTRIYADARAANFTAAGLKQWRWRTAMDELVCPICRPLGLANNGEGQVGTIAGGFQVPDAELIVSRPPAHPGCRCWTVEVTNELEELAAQQPEPMPPKPKPIKKPKPPKAKPPVEPQWQAAMLPEDAAAWAKGTPYGDQTFYVQVPTNKWAKIKAGGFSQEMFDEGQLLPVYHESVKPASAPAKIVIPVRTNIKNPVILQPGVTEQELRKKYKLPLKSQEPIGKLLAQKGYDGIVAVDEEGKVLWIGVSDPSRLVIEVNRYGKPATSKWKPPKKKPVSETSPLFDLTEADLDHDWLATKDLHAADSPWGPAGKIQSYGGVIFDEQGRVLLRRPKGDFGGYVWTWPKGGYDAGEHPVTTALREVAEETGHNTQIIGLVPGRHKGTGGNTCMFLMRSTGHDPTKMDTETAELRWATKEEASELIKQSKTTTGVKRDLRILEAAYDELAKLNDPTYRVQRKQALAALPASKGKKALPVLIPDRFPFAASALKPVGRAPGASHEALLYDAPDGSRWLFKPQAEFLSEIDRTAYRLAKRLGHEAAETHIVNIGGRSGSIQRWYPDVETTVGNLGDRLTPAQTVAAQKEAIFDWLIGNNDGHDHNLLVLRDGRVVGIDKGQAFKFWETDRLDWDYNPNPTPTWHNTLLRRWSRGENVFLAELDHPELSAFLDRIQALDDDEFKAILRPYAERAFASPAGRGTTRRTGVPYDDVERFLDSAVARKNNIRRDFEALYRRAAEARAKALGLSTELRPMTPISPEFIADLRRSGWQGKSLLLGGADVENMTALVYDIEGDGSVVDLKLRPEAEKKLYAALGHVPLPSAASTQNIADPYWDQVLKVAKSYNYHLSPGQDQVIPAHTKQVVAELYHKLAQDASPLAKHYLAYVENLQKSIAAGDKSMVGQFVKQYVPPPPKEERLRGRSPRSIDIKQAENQVLNVRNRRGRIELLPGQVKRKGQNLTGELDDEISFAYTPYGNGNNDVYSDQGHLRFMLKSQADEQKLRRVLDYMQDMGLDGRLASRQDVEWMYLIKTSYAAGVDVSHIVRSETPISAQIKLMQELWSKRLGVADVTRLPSYQPDPYYDSLAPINGQPGGQFGIPRWRRFDISVEELQRQMPGYMLAHGLNDLSGGGPTLDKLRVIVENNNALISTEEKFRLGIPLSKTSPDEDQRSGGATYAFTRLQGSDEIKTSPYNLFFAPELLLDTDVIHYGYDRFGNVHPEEVRAYRLRTIKDWKAHTTRTHSRNEVMIKRNISLIDYLVGIRAETEAEKQEIIQLLKANGYQRIRGVPVENLVWVMRTR